MLWWHPEIRFLRGSPPAPKDWELAALDLLTDMRESRRVAVQRTRAHHDTQTRTHTRVGVRCYFGPSTRRRGRWRGAVSGSRLGQRLQQYRERSPIILRGLCIWLRSRCRPGSDGFATTGCLSSNWPHRQGGHRGIAESDARNPRIDGCAPGCRPLVCVDARVSLLGRQYAGMGDYCPTIASISAPVRTRRIINAICTRSIAG